MEQHPRPSMRTAINAKCKDCVYDPDERGTWRQQTALCAAPHCPLYEVRPVPRECQSGGHIDPVEIAALRSRVEGSRMLARAR